MLCVMSLEVLSPVGGSFFAGFLSPARRERARETEAKLEWLRKRQCEKMGLTGCNRRMTGAQGLSGTVD